MPSTKNSSSRAKATASHQKSSRILSPPTEDNGQQKTISDLFSTSKQGFGLPTDGSLKISPHKRLKTSHQLSSDSEVLAAKPVGPNDMYNFTTSKPKPQAEVVDLTSSDGSPLRRNGNRLAYSSALNPGSGPRKLVVKNMKTAPRTDPQEYFNRVWSQLEVALSALFQDEKLPYSMEELYKGVEFTCRQDFAPELFKKLSERCSNAVGTQVQEALSKSVRLDSDVGTLRVVIGAWSRWNRQFTTLRSIFFFLDRSYLLHKSKQPSLQNVGREMFRESMFMNSALKHKILQGACDFISSKRNGQLNAADEAILQDAIQMFHELQVYTKHFEPKMLSESEQYFNSWTEQAIASNDLAGYVEMCDKLITEESVRADVLGLEDTTKKALQTYLEDILVDQRQNRLVAEEDFGNLLLANRVVVVLRLFSLLQRRYLGDKLRQPFEAHINKQGSEIVFDEAREREMVARLLDFKRKLNVIWEKAFLRHEGLGHSLREAFESFINKSKRTNMNWGTDNPKPGEMIAKHVDAILRDGSKAIRATETGVDTSSKEVPPSIEEDPVDQADQSVDEDAEITHSLDQVLDLFRFVHGKAVFEAFYKKDLARRLLLGRSASSDAEKSMLTRLKSECGAGFTHNLEQMFKDIEMARDEITSYKTMSDERGRIIPFDLNVNVLSASAWPSYPTIVVNMPEAILRILADFEQYYKTKHSGRKLEWKHALAHCQLKANFPKGNKELVVSSFQAIMLLAFKSGETLSYADLQATSRLDDIELKRTLQSLACARYRPLRKTPQGKDVHTTDTFTINTSFTHPKYRIKINQIQAKETKAENQATHERVAADRQYETQAAIVRIMKSRRRITHPELVSEVIIATKSRGVLDPADIKKNIEKLIEKDYMEREDEANVYQYVA